MDVITIADTPLVYQALNRGDFYIIAGITRSETIAGAVARRDHGINQPADIKGKKIGLFKGTASDYLLDQYLLNNDLYYRDLELVDLKPLQLLESITSGDIDAIFSWQPHIHHAMQRLGDNAYRLPTDGIKTLDWVVVVMKDYAHRHPDKLVKFLRAQDRAIAFINSNRHESIDIFASKSGIQKNIVEALWDEFSFGLYLSESMLINLESQARWVLKRRNEAGNIPNYLTYIYFDALVEINPQAISVIR